MSGFWSTETLQDRLPELMCPFEPSQIVNSAYELGMGNQAYVTGTKRKTRQSLTNGAQLLIPPGQFAILLTREIVRIPDDALGFISMKSSFKMRGLINVSGFHVDPGYEGRLLFSVYNAGSQGICISEGKPAFLLWYSSLDATTTDLYSGARAGLTEITDEDVMRIHGDTYTPQALAERVNKLENRLSVRRELLFVAIGALIATVISFGYDRVQSNDNDKAADDAQVQTDLSEDTMPSRDSTRGGNVLSPIVAP